MISVSDNPHIHTLSMSWLNKQTLNKQKDSKGLYKGLY